MDRYILIIGSMKSGTTTLFSMLDQHPQIASAHPKEAGFFAFDAVYAQGREWFHSLFTFDPHVHRYRLDGTTDYTKVPYVTGVRERMAAQDGVEFKLIYIMRHPLRRIESHARHVQRTRREIGRVDSPRPDHGLDAGVSLESLAMGRYAAQLDVYEDMFEAGDVFLTTLEELKASPDQVISNIWAFLDLPPHKIEITQENVGGSRRTQRKIWGTLTSHAGALSLAKRILPHDLRKKIQALFSQQKPVEGRFTLTATEEDAILAQLQPDLRRLRDRYGIDVETLWNIQP